MLHNYKLIFKIVIMCALAFGAYFLPSFLIGVKIVYNSYPETGDEVVVRFGNLISEEAAQASFHIEPEVEGEFVWLEDYQELHFLPNEGFSPQENYKVTIKSDQYLFSTLVIPTKNFTFSTVSFSQPVKRDAYQAPSLGKYIDINLSSMILTLVENGAPVKSFPVAGKGNPNTKPTREGKFEILSKEPLHFSTLSRVFMPWSMQYSGDYFIHDWPYWTGGRKLNSKYSNGCIRLFNGDAEAVYNWAEVGTEVLVHSTPERLAVFSAEVMKDGDLVREEGGQNIFIIKQKEGQRFKRWVWTTDFQKWYGHFYPFWQKIKVVESGTLVDYAESIWVKLAGSSTIYELNVGSKIAHPILCSKILNSEEKSQEFCEKAWETYGWPLNEIFTISEKEFNVYKLGESIELRPF